MAELKDVARALVYLASLYPNFQMAKETPGAYHTVLGDIPADTLMVAAQQVGANNTFFPAAAELRRAAMSLMERADGRVSGEEAWEQVCREIRDTGYYRVPQFSDPMIYRAVDSLGGWKTICASENIIADRAHFLKIYEVLSGRRREDSAMLPNVRQAIAQLAEKKRLALPSGEDE